MRLNYLDYQIVYLEETGDASVYRKNKEIVRANIPEYLNKENLIKNLAIIMTLPGVMSKCAEQAAI